MKTVKLKIANLSVDGVQQPEGAVVMVPDVRAAELIRLGHAEAHYGSVVVANLDHNPLADCISPAPEGGLILDPVNALSLNVQDNPGLKKAVEIAGTSSRSAKVKPGDVKEGNPTVKAEDKTTPATTANEVVTTPENPTAEKK